MRTRLSAVAAALAVGAALPAAASAAQIQTDQACYQDNTGLVAVTGNGFDPDQPYQVALDGQPLPTSALDKTDAAGGISGAFETPQLAREDVHVYTLQVTQGANVATTTFSVSPFSADFKPGSGNPKTLHVRFNVFGFGLARPNPTVFLHYVRPNGKLKRTIRLGKAQGACGTIKRTSRKKLFPFQAERGKWKLQFDTQRKYRKAHRPFVTIDVIIRRVFG